MKLGCAPLHLLCGLNNGLMVGAGLGPARQISSIGRPAGRPYNFLVAQAAFGGGASEAALPVSHCLVFHLPRHGMPCRYPRPVINA